jgi:hypothetical protein
MKQILVVLILIVILSCEKSIDEPLPKLSEYSVKSMLYSGGENITSKVKLFYNSNDQIVQRIGRLVTLGPKTDQQIFSDDHADTLIYLDNLVEIHDQYFHDGITDFSSAGSTFRFENGLLMYRGSYFSLTNSSTEYTYNKIGQIISSTNFHVEGSFDPENLISEFQYNSKGNLTLVVIETFFNYDYNVKIRTDSLWFSDYDNAPNLTKNLVVFEECFYRALSTNNFRKYNWKRVDHYRDVTLIGERTWQFDYDDKGYPIY